MWTARAKRMVAIDDATGGDQYYLDVFSLLNDRLKYMFCKECPLTREYRWTAALTTLSYEHKLATEQSSEHARPMKVCAQTAPMRHNWQSTIKAQQWRRQRDLLPASEAIL